MAVVVNPIRRDHPFVDLDRNGQLDIGGNDGAPIEQRLLEGGECLACAEAAIAQTVHHLDQAVIAQRLQLADRQTRCLQIHLGIALRADPVEQLVGEVGDVHQLGPRPFQRRPELGHEMAHSSLAAGDAVDQERPHEAPPQPGAEAHRVVDLGGRGHAIVHQPEGLTP